MENIKVILSSGVKKRCGLQKVLAVLMFFSCKRVVIKKGEMGVVELLNFFLLVPRHVVLGGRVEET